MAKQTDVTPSTKRPGWNLEQAENNKKETAERGGDISETQDSEFVARRRYGEIDEKDSYRKDSQRPKG